MISMTVLAECVLRVAARSNTHAARVSADDAQDLLESLTVMSAPKSRAIAHEPLNEREKSVKNPAQIRVMEYLRLNGSGTAIQISDAFGVEQHYAANILYRLKLQKKVEIIGEIGCYKSHVFAIVKVEEVADKENRKVFSDASRSSTDEGDTERLSLPEVQ